MDCRLERITVPGAAMLAVVTRAAGVVETGDNIVAVSPIWPNIVQAAQICGAATRFVSLDDDWNASPPRWRLDLDKLFDACDARTKAIFISSPEQSDRLDHDARRTARRARLRAARAASPSSATKSTARSSMTARRMRRRSCRSRTTKTRCSSINSFSKPWAMTGWRIGWLVHPKSLDTQMWMMSAANNTGATTFAQ